MRSIIDGICSILDKCWNSADCKQIKIGGGKSMDMQNGTMTLKEAKEKYLKKARELKQSENANLNSPDLYIEDQIGEMALILIRLFKKEKGRKMTDLEEIKLYQQILAELTGEQQLSILK